MDHLKYSSKAWYTNNTHITQDEKLKMNVLAICKKKGTQGNSFSKPTSNLDVNTFPNSNQNLTFYILLELLI